MPAAPPRPLRLPPAHTPRWRAAVLLAGAVALLHAALLSGRPTPPSTTSPRKATLPLTIRALAALPPTAVAQTAAPTATPAKTPQPAPRPARASDRANSQPAALAGALADTAPDAQTPNAPNADNTPDTPDTRPVPVYATALPSAATLHFELRRGSQSGQAVMAWRPGESAYELTLDSSAFGVQALGSASRGAFDAAGMAPERYVDKRRGREVRAANFQREANLISFSGPPQTLPLSPGSQDRLSWMLQLPAILQANPALASAGAQVQMRVVGSRGEADVWVFTVQGFEDLQLPAGPVQAALHLQRLPRRPYDTLVEIWLDPARQHLPVRARLGIRPNGDSTEFLLQRLE